jgi:hypothetical protein
MGRFTSNDSPTYQFIRRITGLGPIILENVMEKMLSSLLDEQQGSVKQDPPLYSVPMASNTVERG